MHRRKEWLLCVILTALLLGTALYLCVKDKPTDINFIFLSPETPAGEITEGVAVVQTLPVERSITEVALEFATWGRTNAGTVTVEIQGGDSGALYALQTMDAAQMQDNCFVAFPLTPAAAPERDSFLRVTVTADSRPGEAVTLWATATDQISGELTVGGTAQSGDLVAELRSPDEYLTVFYIILVLAAFSMAIGAVWVILWGKWPWKRVFTALAFCFGLLYLLTITPRSAPDEEAHYATAYRFSNYLCATNPDRDLADSADFDYTSLYKHRNAASAYLRLLNELGEADRNGELIPVPLREDWPTSIFFLQYTPLALGVSLARGLGLNMLWKFYLGRLFNLLFYCVCLYFSIKSVPRFGLLFGVLGISPMVLHQAATFSGDSSINGLAFLLVALLLRAIFCPEPLTRGRYAALLLTACLLTPAKVVYAPLCLLALAIPAERFGGRRAKWRLLALAAVAVAAVCAVFYLPPLLSKLTAEGGPALNWQGEYNYTPRFVLTHPGETAAIFARTLWREGSLWLTEAFGLYLSGLSLVVPLWIVLGFMALAVLAAQGGSKADLCPAGWLRWNCLGLAAGITLLTMLALFLTWTSDSSPLVLGVQGRYFIPLLPLAGVALCSRRITLGDGAERVVAMLTACLSVCPILTILAYTL